MNLKACVCAPLFFKQLCLWLWCTFRSQNPFMSARPSQDPPGAFPDGLQNSYPYLDWHRCQVCVCLQGIQTGDLAHHFLSGQRRNFWRSSECSWTSCTCTKLGVCMPVSKIWERLGAFKNLYFIKKISLQSYTIKQYKGTISGILRH